MNVYLLRPDPTHFQALCLIKEEEWSRMRTWFRGNPIGRDWWPVGVVAVDDDLNEGLPQGDFPSLSGTVPVFNEQAVKALEDMLRPNGEILPLTCEGATYFAYNCTRVVEALDEERSDCQRFPSGRVMRIRRHEFQPERLAGLTIFMLPDRLSGDVFVTDEFVERSKQSGLTGFDFRAVWSGSVPGE